MSAADEYSKSERLSTTGGDSNKPLTTVKAPLDGDLPVTDGVSGPVVGAGGDDDSVAQVVEAGPVVGAGGVDDSVAQVVEAGPVGGVDDSVAQVVEAGGVDDSVAQVVEAAVQGSDTPLGTEVSADSIATPLPKKPPVKVLEGIVTSVTSEEVGLDLPDGRSAVIYRRNFGLQNEDPTSVLSVGDGALGAELARDDPKGRIVLSRSWVLKKQKWEKLEAVAEASEFISGTVLSANKNGLVVDVGVRGFVPASHIELEPVADLKPYIGQVIEVKIIEVSPSNERLVLSRRPILLRQERQKIKKLLSSLSPGDIKTGSVVSLVDYGAFVDLGGIKGLVHVSELAWERVTKPGDILTIGDEVQVKILEINIKKRRIGLSLRQLKEDPLATIEVGSIITGRVTRLVDFGAFIDIGAIEGLAHLSELAEYRVQAPEEIVAPGDQVRVKVLSVDPKRRRVALSVRQAAEFGG